MLKIKARFKLITYVVGFMVLAGCAATHTAINKRELDVQTKMSNSIFLDPVAPALQTVYVQIKNTSDKPELELGQDIRNTITSKGYRIVTDPNAAHYLFQVNILQVGKADLRATEKALEGGFNGTLSGALAGAAVGAMGSNHHDAIVGMTVLGAVAGTVIDAVVKDVAYSIITDVQVSERLAQAKEVKVQETTSTGAAVVKDSVLERSTNLSGETKNRKTRSTETEQWKRYQTRIISTANKTNLKFEDALPELIRGLKNAIGGIMG